MSLNSANLVEKLSKLNTSQQSIETLSQWCIFYKKDAEQIVTLWEKEFNRTKEVEKMLALIYLANDILQNSRKKGPQFVNEFFAKLPPAVHKLVQLGGSPVKNKILKMIHVWDERRVFGSSGVKSFTDLIQPTNHAAPSTQGRKRGNIVLQTNDPSVNSLSSSMQEADQAHTRCQTLLSQNSALLRKDESQNGAESLKASVKTLQIQITALENEIGHRDRVLSILSDLLSQQDQMKRGAEEKWTQLKSDLTQRQSMLSNSQNNSQGNHSLEQSSSPMPPPMDPPDSPPNMNDPRLARLSSDLKKSAPSSQEIPSHSGELGNAELMSQLLGGLKDDKAEDQAAQLVARLSQSGTSAQMLLDALAALPQDAEQGGSQQDADASASMENMEEEYDPELGE